MLRRLYSGWNLFANCGSDSEPSAEYIFFEKRTTSSAAVQLARQTSSSIMTYHSGLILDEQTVSPFILQAGYFMMAIGFTFSLILAYVVVIALLVTAFGMHYFEPGIVVVVTRTVSFDQDEDQCISVVYAD